MERLAQRASCLQLKRGVVRPHTLTDPAPVDRHVKVFDSQLTARQQELVAKVHAQAPATTIHIHYNVEWAQPDVPAITCPRKDTQKPPAPVLLELWQQLPRRAQSFLIAVRKCLDDTKLVITVAHEVEHVRQELKWPGIVKLRSVAWEFARLTGLLVTYLQVPLEKHAEVVGARCAAALLGWDQVLPYYRSELPEMLDVVIDQRFDPKQALADLCSFFDDHGPQYDEWRERPEQLHRPTRAQIHEKVRAWSNS